MCTMSCGIEQGYDLHKIQVYIVLVSVYHENFVSLTIISQTVNIFLPEFLLLLFQASELCKDDHEIFNINRQDKRGGGIVLLYYTK